MQFQISELYFLSQFNPLHHAWFSSLKQIYLYFSNSEFLSRGTERRSQGCDHWKTIHGSCSHVFPQWKLRNWLGACTRQATVKTYASRCVVSPGLTSEWSAVVGGVTVTVRASLTCHISTIHQSMITPQPVIQHESQDQDSYCYTK